MFSSPVVLTKIHFISETCKNQICLIFQSCHSCQICHFFHLFYSLKASVLHYTFAYMLSEIIKKKIENKSGLRVRYVRDCNALAEKISSECHCRISGSTLRRLYGLGLSDILTLTFIGFLVPLTSYIRS